MSTQFTYTYIQKKKSTQFTYTYIQKKKIDPVHLYIYSKKKIALNMPNFFQETGKRKHKNLFISLPFLHV